MAARALPATSLLLALVGACATEPNAEPTIDLPHATAQPSCGPADGPAVAIYLAADPIGAAAPSAAPYARIAVWHALGELAGQSWNLTNSGVGGAAWLHSAPNTFEVATRATLTVRAVGPDSTIEGSVDAVFPSGARIREDFRASWRSVRLLCG